jgi:hypothetical protein
MYDLYYNDWFKMGMYLTDKHCAEVNVSAGRGDPLGHSEEYRGE